MQTERRREDQEQRDPRDSIAALRPQTRCYLAVLVLARQWPGRFRDGWVDRATIAQYGVNTGGDERETGQRAASRAWKQLEQLHPVVRIQLDPLPGNKKRRRLVDVPSALVDWLYSDGVHQLVPGEWRAFLTESSRDTEESSILQGLDEVAAELLIAQGRHREALAALDVRLDMQLPTRDVAALEHLRARAIIRRGGEGDWQLAHATLTRLTSAPLTDATLLDRLFGARIRIDLAYAHFLTRMMGLKDATALEREAIVVAGWLDRATVFEPILSHGDLARLRNVEGLVAKCFLRTTIGQERETRFLEARQKLLDAFSLYRLAAEAIGLGNVTYNLGELLYVYHHLDEPGASAAAVRDALRWYELALAFNTRLGTNLDRLYDYARIADCLGLLIALEREARPRAERKADLERAREFLALVRSHGALIERRLADWTEARLDAHAYLAGLLEPPKGKDPTSILSGLDQSSQSLREFAEGQRPVRERDREQGR